MRGRAQALAPHISVALATYQGERHLRDQLRSLATQTLLPHECVICDDGSTDATLGIAREFAAAAPFPVHVHENPQRLGYADNFLRAASLCTGDAISFCDQDDVWLPGKLARVAAELWRTGAVLVVHAGAAVDAELVPVGITMPPIERDEVAAPLRVDPWFPADGFAITVARSILELADPAERPRSRWPAIADACNHDEWAWYVGTACGTTSLVAEPLVLHRLHGSNTSGGRSGSETRAAELRRSRAAGAGEAGARYRFLAERAAEWSAYFEREALRGPGGEPSARLERAARHYAAIAERWRRRERIYTATPSVRAAQLALLLASGGYRSRRRGGLGAVSFARDGLSLAGVV